MVQGGHRVACTFCGYGQTHLDVGEAIRDYRDHGDVHAAAGMRGTADVRRD